jgi:catechol 2,3-dioxygenase-like lactoylglutathione lyase family enzyme
MTARQVECTIPVLGVRDLQRSIVFYTGKLGFQMDWSGDLVGSVSRDGCCIMLSAMGNVEPGGWVWIGLENDSLFKEYRAKGVAVHQEPRNFSWAWEMKFADPYGNILWLGTEPRSDIPLEDRDSA